MIQVSDLSKRYGDNLVFHKVNFTLNAGDRTGLIGPNGSGKTTLLRILVGEEAPDTGSVHLTASGVRIGYLPQALSGAEDTTVGDVLAAARGEDEAHLVARVEWLATKLAQAEGEQLAALEQQYARALEQLAVGSLIVPEHLMAQVLAGLGLGDVAPATPVSWLSGGQKTRLGLARVLLRNPSVLLLDEPTNHLDITALEWLEEYLRRYQGAMLVVSHDRTFLDRTITSILELDALAHTLNAYPGSYSDYASAKRREAERHWQAYKEQEEKIANLESAVRQLKGQARRVEKETVHYHYRKKAKKVARQAIVRQKRIERLLASEDHVEKPQFTWGMKLEFVETPPSGQVVLTLEELGKRFGDQVLFEQVNLCLRKDERIALVGPNGSGKTTLLRIIAAQEEATTGRCQLGANVRPGYFSQEQENLDKSLAPLEVVRHVAALTETEARAFLHLFLFAGDDVFLPVGSLSFGERARLALGVLVLQGCNLLLLDEPINHLDVPSRERFEQALEAYQGTVLAVVHDRYFIEHFATGIWAIQNRSIRRYVDLGDARRSITND